METIGLIGGMSWESSLEYYRIINETIKEELGGLHSAKCLLYSVDFEEIEKLQHQNKWDELTEIMVDAAEKLKKGGADFIVICANTMHKMANELESRTGLKVLHIAEATGKNIVEKGIKKVGLLGTHYTMEGDFYKNILNERFHIEVVIPSEEERNIVHDIIYDELCRGVISSTSKEKYIKIINNLASNGAEGVILGCTEIPLLIKDKDVDLSIFDTTMIHATAAAKLALKSKK